MNVIESYLRKDIKPLSPILMILFVSIGRMVFEIGLFGDKPNAFHILQSFTTTVVFYTLVFFLFSCLMVPVLSLKFEKVAKLVCVGLLFGFIPPILDCILPLEMKRYLYFTSFSWSLVSPHQPMSETIALWGVVGGVGVFTLLLKKSVLRTIAAIAGAYLIFQGCTGVVVYIRTQTMRLDIWINLSWMILSFICFCILRYRRLAHSLKRIIHALPHSLLVLCGAAWVAQPLGNTVYKMIGVFFVLFVVVIQNDFYDRSDDGKLDESKTIGEFELVFSYFFVFLIFLWALRLSPIYAFLLVCLSLVGFLYNHPAVRLKKRFCLSYKAEGAAALLAFLAGTIVGKGFAEGYSLFWPGLLVFGGGTLLSIPKDWKDVEVDRQAGVPSYYVVLTKRGWKEKTVHFWICIAVTIGLFIPPVFFMIADGVYGEYLELLALALLPGGFLLKLKNRKSGVLGMLVSFTFYIGLLIICVQSFRIM